MQSASSSVSNYYNLGSYSQNLHLAVSEKVKRCQL